uniref:Uncharacterized protein n=1 Tax=Anguilla anguilla TaxID=7936 RepID=A0A0E9PA21_ANGAN
MTGLSLNLPNVSLEQTMEGEMRENVDAQKDFQTVEVGELEEGKNAQKAPRRVIHFASGETMEEYSTEDEEEEPEKKDLLSPDPVSARGKRRIASPSRTCYLLIKATF